MPHNNSELEKNMKTEARPECAVLMLDAMAAESSDSWGRMMMHCIGWSACHADQKINSDGIIESVAGTCLRFEEGNISPSLYVEYSNAK